MEKTHKEIVSTDIMDTLQKEYLMYKVNPQNPTKTCTPVHLLPENILEDMEMHKNSSNDYILFNDKHDADSMLTNTRDSFTLLLISVKYIPTGEIVDTWGYSGENAYLLINKKFLRDSSTGTSKEYQIEVVFKEITKEQNMQFLSLLHAELGDCNDDTLC
jgi:hypothetical protein